MNREEAIQVLKEYRTIVMNCLEAETPAYDMAIEALDERKVELFDDGTLVVNVKEGEKVGRVLIEGDDHFGGLYYIDAEPVKHGEWINKRLTKDSIKDIKDGTYGELIGYHDICSVCGFDIDKFWWATGSPNYCPNCGAKMKGQEE